MVLNTGSSSAMHNLSQPLGGVTPLFYLYLSHALKKKKIRVVPPNNFTPDPFTQRERDRQSETQRERDRERERQTDRQTDGQRERKTERETETERLRQTERGMEREKREGGIRQGRLDRTCMHHLFVLLCWSFLFLKSIARTLSTLRASLSGSFLLKEGCRKPVFGLSLGSQVWIWRCVVVNVRRQIIRCGLSPIAQFVCSFKAVYTLSWC